MIRNIKWDITGLSEVRRYGEKLVKRNNGNWFYYVGESKGYQGVGFYIHKKWTDRVIEIKGVNERLAILKLQLEEVTTVAIFQVYTPTNQADNSAKEQFYYELNDAFVNEKGYHTLIAGDFNAKIGKENVNDKNIGSFRVGDTKDNGILQSGFLTPA